MLAIDPHHAKAHFELGLLYGGPLHDPARARRHLELALASGHPRPDEIQKLLAKLPPA